MPFTRPKKKALNNSWLHYDTVNQSNKKLFHQLKPNQVTLILKFMVKPTIWSLCSTFRPYSQNLIVRAGNIHIF